MNVHLQYSSMSSYACMHGHPVYCQVHVHVYTNYSQVCVDECPEDNEFGVRDNPVCVDEVDTERYQNITDIDIGTPQLIAVRELYRTTYYTGADIHCSCWCVYIC